MINFLGLAGRTAGIVRGKQISEKLSGSEYGEAHFTRIGSNPITIIVRNHIPTAAAIHRKAGKLVGYDVCDMPAGDAFFGKKNISIEQYCHPDYDFFIVNNDSCAKDLMQHTDKPVYVIPHHTVNYEAFKNEVREKVQRIGYVGLPEQLSRSKEISDYCKGKGIDFFSAHPNSREECDAAFRKIDIGIVFLDSSTHNPELLKLVKRFKPNTKMSNMQSYGIPTVSVSYDSYEQFGKGVFVRVENIDELISEIDSLIDNYDKRSSLSGRSYEVGCEVGIDPVTKMYVAMAKDLSERFIR